MFSSYPSSNVPAMSSSPDDQDFEFSRLQSTTVDLPQAAVDWSIQIIQSAPDAVGQWSSFLRALAVRGFQQWVEDGTLDVAVHYDAQRIPPAEISCRVGDLRLCLITLGSLSDEVVRIPRATLDDPHHFVHCYVLTEVEEEEDRVTILSGLRRDRLLAVQPITEWVLNADDTYTIPVRHFDTAPEELLLYLNCLNPERLAVPISSAAATTDVAPAWIESVPNIGDELINVGCWLRDQLGEVADRLAWALLPPLPQLDTAMAMRTQAEEIADILTELSPSVTVPSNARGAYTDFQSFGAPIRLYALTWLLFETELPEWSLLLCLGPSDNSQLPLNTQLVIRDDTSILVEQTLTSDSGSAYLYGQVVGALGEPFWVSVALPNGTTLNLPPFGFQPDR
ncbi:MAG: DUF1822 family protein [Cyanobacteria bacterium P01_F01_bin.86]